MDKRKQIKHLTLFAAVLALAVIVMGAYTRLTDAGLGCPDWPGCYGHLYMPKSVDQVQAAEQAFPERPFEAHKARNEMVHRYIAGTLGLVILVIFLLSWRNRQFQTPLKLPLLLVLLVIFQGALGMWTVTLNLLPVIVMGHLLGGFGVICCLFLLYLRLAGLRIPGGDIQVKGFAKFTAIGIAILVIQIALGGWTSANYASLACTELPICEGNWPARLDFSGAFSIPEAENYEFGVHPYEARMTMHVLHRFGAILVFLYLCWLAVAIYRQAASNMVKQLSIVMVLALGVQVMLGVSNVVFSLPVSVAVLHNAVAACLLMIMLMLSYVLYRKA